MVASQRFGAHVRLSQGKSSPQAEETNPCDLALGLLGAAGGRGAVPDGFCGKR